MALHRCFYSFLLKRTFQNWFFILFNLLVLLRVAMGHSMSSPLTSWACTFEGNKFTTSKLNKPLHSFQYIPTRRELQSLMNLAAPHSSKYIHVRGDLESMLNLATRHSSKYNLARGELQSMLILGTPHSSEYILREVTWSPWWTSQHLLTKLSHFTSSSHNYLKWKWSLLGNPNLSTIWSNHKSVTNCTYKISILYYKQSIIKIIQMSIVDKIYLKKKQTGQWYWSNSRPKKECLPQLGQGCNNYWAWTNHKALEWFYWYTET
jgi:hypothetical protein